MEDGPRIITRKGDLPGKRLAVFAGIHGNEQVGVDAVNDVLEDLQVLRGEVVFVFANTRALEQGVRYTERNLNRCFTRESIGDTYEDAVARELMSLLDSVDALLDVHASNTPGATPFVIYEEPAEDFVRYLEFDIVSTGWVDVEPGATDEYMYRQGKPGICIECGYIKAGDEHRSLASKSIRTFLSYYGAIDEPLPAPRTQRHLQVHTALIKEHESFEYYRQYADFESLPSGTSFAKDESQEYRVEEESVIIFATQKAVGDEVGILGKWV